MSLNHFNNIINALNKENIFFKNPYIDLSLLNNISTITYSKVLFSDFIVSQNVFDKEILEPEINLNYKILEELNFTDFKSNLYMLKNKVFALIAQGIYSKEFDFNKSSYLISNFASLILSKIFYYCEEKINLNSFEKIVLIALGKLGGYELNFCSDVDIVFFKSKDLNDDKAIKFVRLFLNTATSIFNVDLNLRPGGENSKIIHNIDEAINYYKGWGSSWEKIALLKTRFICGDKTLFDEFVLNIKDFVFRKYLDYSCIEEYRTIKKILILEKKDGIFNIKKDAGGIRYLEFYAAILLLIFSGRINSLKKLSLSFLDTILLLFENKIIKEDEYLKLKNNYIYLRDLENIVQTISNKQTHEIRNNALNIILYIKYDLAFLKDTEKYIFEHNKIIEENNNIFLSLLSQDINVDNYYTNDAVQSIINKINNSYVSNDIKNKIIKLIFYIQEKNTNNNILLNRLDILVQKLKTKLSVLLIFYENPKLIDNFIAIILNNNYFFDELLKYPELLDLFILDFEDTKLSYQINLKNSLNSFINDEDDINLRFEKLKLFKSFQEFKAYTYLDKDFKLVLTRLSYTAKLIIRHICAYLNFNNENFCVFAKGGIGDNSSSFNSDLDLIFIVDTKDYNEYEIILKYAKKFTNLINIKSKYGPLYKLDTRLNHENTFILTNFSNFLDYYKNSNFIDTISLWKLSYIWGDKNLAKKILKFKYYYLKNIFSKNLLNKVYTDEINKYRVQFQKTAEFKYKRGSLIDLEYVVRLYQSKNYNFLKNINNYKEKTLNNYYELLKKYEIYVKIQEESNINIKDVLNCVEKELLILYG